MGVQTVINLQVPVEPRAPSKKFDLKDEDVQNVLTIYKKHLREINDKWFELEDLGTDMLVSKDNER